METIEIFRELEKGLHTIQSLLANMTQDESAISPDEESWSALQVLCHLIDEEREDFRRHIEQALSEPQEKWHAVDPQGWVAQRRYHEQSFDEKLAEFQMEREKSLRWLKGLPAADWEQKISAPFGEISAGSLLASWAIHDNLHIRQLVEIRQVILKKKSEPFNTLYAGEW